MEAEKLPPLNRPSFSQTKDDSKKILSLINKALASPSLKEKNELIDSIRSLWAPQNEELETLATTNRTKQENLDHLRASYTEAADGHKTLLRNTSFYGKVDPAKCQGAEQGLTQTIQALEKDILKLSSVTPGQYTPRVPPTGQTAESRYFNLFDLKFKRLEELAYSYKKRLLTIEQSQESTDTVLSEFGSVNGLLEKAKMLETENANLREIEYKFISDALTRRRKISSMGASTSRTLCLSFASLIKSENEIADSYKLHSFHVPQGEAPTLQFEQICADTGFSVGPSSFDQSEFGNTLDTDLTDGLVKDNPLPDKVNTLKSIISQSETNISKIVVEIGSCKDKTKERKDGGQQKIEKAMEDNQALFEKVAQVQASLDSFLEENTKVAKQLNAAIISRKGYWVQCEKLTYCLKNEAAGHIVLIERLNSNKSVLKSLLYLCCAFGIYLLNGEKSPLEGYLTTKFKESISAETSLQKVTSKTVVSPLRPESAATGNVMELAGIIKKSVQRPRKAAHSVRRHSPDDAQSGTEKVVSASPSNLQIPPSYLSINATRTEVFHGLALLMQLAGFSIGVDKKFDRMFLKAFTRLTKDFADDSRGLLQKFKADQLEALSRILFVGNRILVKEKASEMIQTDTDPRADEETQCDDGGAAKVKKH